MLSTAPYNVAGSTFVVAFYPDGSLVLPAAEKAYDPDVALTADIILIQNGQTCRLYMDMNPPSGKMRKQGFRTQ